VKKTSTRTPAAAQLASSPCLLHELRADGTPIDPQQDLDVARWRKAERDRLIKSRCLLPVQYRTDQAATIARRCEEVISSAGMATPIVSLYWPIRGEPDLRPWMHALSRTGRRVALPVAVAPAQPLVFREWLPHARLARGLWKIPYPVDGEIIIPTVVIAPVVGFDQQCYRLGYGGGFFDRTLAALNPQPLTIGVGYPDAAIRTIFPQPHDIPMDWVVTGSAAHARRDAAVHTPPTPDR
jgi:5-formyltetrahydrofolate cyclo-ligase